MVEGMGHLSQSRGYGRVLLCYNTQVMTRYDDRRRDEARQRLAARQSKGFNSQSYPDDDYASPRGARRSGSPSLSSLHSVSPEMRERYSNMDSGGRRTSSRQSRYDDYGDYGRGGRYDRYDDFGYDDRGMSEYDWNTPSVDPIGGRSLTGRGAMPGPGAAGASRGRLGLAFWAVLGLVFVLIVLLVLVSQSSCSSNDATQATQEQQLQESGAAAEGAADASASGAAAESSGTASGSAAAGGSTASQASDADGIDRAKLEAILDEETVDKLIMRAETSEEAKWIAQHPEAYAGDGDAVQAKLLTLAANEPAAYTYVRDYPDKYPMATPANGKIQTVATGRGIPRLYQWDEIWGYTTYSGAAFGLTGCAPTVMAMVYQGLTGNTDLSPYDMAELAERDGYMTSEEGTIGSFFTDEASALGLNEHSIDVSEKALKEALQSTEVVVVNFGPGDFTEYGHYVVLTGLTQEGEIIMNDPYSEERSEKRWDYDIIVENAIAFYAYY